ncbi:MAG: NUDIX hydrolase [Lachnospiraceae bacterium]|nr:NUDIX hydrolase [Lachnospiraceae bacterium]
MNGTNRVAEEGEKEFLSRYHPEKYASISITVDAIVVGVAKDTSDNYRKLDRQSLKILLVKREHYPYKDCYSLPGGFVGEKETFEETLRRVLLDKTGLADIYSEQLYTFGGVERDPRMRIVSCAYISLVDINRTSITGAEWFAVEDIRNMELAFDHNRMIEEALKRLSGKINYTDIVFHMMPPEFTISELQEVYELILGKKLLPAAFRRTISEKLEDTGKMTSNAGHRPSRIFRFRKGA